MADADQKPAWYTPQQPQQAAAPAPVQQPQPVQQAPAPVQQPQPVQQAPTQYRPPYNLGNADTNDYVVNTINGEATSSPESTLAVINNMFNRLGTKGYGPSNNLFQVASAPGQYAGHTPATPARAQQIRSMLSSVASGQVPDNTNGSNEYRASWYSGPWGQKHANAPVVGGNRFAYNPKVAPGPYAATRSGDASDWIQQNAAAHGFAAGTTPNNAGGGGGGSHATGGSFGGSGASVASSGSSPFSAGGGSGATGDTNDQGSNEYNPFAQQDQQQTASNDAWVADPSRTADYEDFMYGLNNPFAQETQGLGMADRQLPPSKLGSTNSNGGTSAADSYSQRLSSLDQNLFGGEA